MLSDDAIAKLIARRDSLDVLLMWLGRGMILFTTLVVLGLWVEYRDPIAEAWKDRRWRILQFWRLPHMVLGGFLITGGVAGELLIEFFASRNQETLRTISGSIETHFNTEAAKARVDAGRAIEGASKAGERATENEKEAARLSKLAESEALARMQLLAAIEPRTLTLKQQQHMADVCRPFSGQSIGVFSYAGDAEGARLSVQIMAALGKAQVRVGNRVGSMMLVGGAPLAGIFISNVDPGLAAAISDSLAAARIPSTINPPRANGEEMTMTVGVKPYSLLR